MKKTSLILLSLSLIGAASLAPTSALAAPPLPATAPSSAGMVDLPGAGATSNSITVRTIAQAGANVWVGGLFDEIDNAAGERVAAAGDLAGFDATTGEPVSGLHVPIVTSSKGTAEVYDSSIGPDGALYFAGNFDAVDGYPRHNTAAIDPSTGALLPFAPVAGPARAILATANAVYVGTSKLLAFRFSGSPKAGYTAPEVFTDPALRSEMTLPLFRDIAKDGNVLVAACQCDRLVDAKGKHSVKAAVEINATTGRQIKWSLAGVGHRSQASGLGVVVRPFPGTSTPTVYLAAGGNDFTGAYDLVSGAKLWREDTSGSSQAVTWYQGYLVVGGHFDWTQKPGGSACGTNAAPERGCYLTPRLVALDASTGAPLLGADGAPWDPGICCRYNGVWALLTGLDGSTLDVGGEFTLVGGSWTCSDTDATCYAGGTTQKFYARFAGPGQDG